ncbi:MAG: Hsp70 family protein [Rhodomicrobiaceae bacterium]
MAIVGIDLGTTNSLVSYWSDDGPKLIPNALKSFLTPSVVGVDDQGDILIGEAAKERLITHPHLTIGDFKRTMGSETVVKLADGTHSYQFRPEELSAFVLRSLKADAEQHLGEDVTGAIISVPAYFNDIQRKATIDAGKLAGLKVDSLINEPTAAALAYGLNEVDESQFLIFDLGGGTFDVSILDKYDNVMEVRATAGDNFLGGNDFRDLLLETLASDHKMDLEQLSASDKNKLIRLAELVKKDLSAREEATYLAQISDVKLEGSFSRDRFEELTSSLRRRLRVPMERAINDATLRPENIDNVVMVGGASRMPMIRRMVGRLFQKLPLSHLNPDEIVALGAAVQTGLKTRNAALEDVVMTDVCPYTLGTSAVVDDNYDNLVIVPIIERNAVVPISESQQFFTIRDKQTQINLDIYQGENMRPEDNILLGDLKVEVPAAPAGKEGVDVRFTYDINGALEVEVKVLSTEKVVRKIFKNQANLSDEELEKRFKALSGIKLHPREHAENAVLIAKAERIYAESLKAQRDFVRSLILDFEQAITDQSNRDLDKVREQFSQSLTELENSMFDMD